MSKSTKKFHSVKEMIEALRQTRDEARVQLHLFSLDAQTRWGEIEDKLLELETRLEQGLENVAEHGIDVVSKQVNERIRRARNFVSNTSKADQTSAKPSDGDAPAPSVQR